MGRKSAKTKNEPKGKSSKVKRVVVKSAATESDASKGVQELSGKDYERELKKLHGELVKLQQWVQEKGLKVCIVFEGRDGAGKGGTIKAITERVSPRVFRVIALPSPTEREKSQMYAQRYVPHFPAAGEIVIFDRSWYNRAGVERVMGFCTEEQAEGFLKVAPLFEKLMIQSGIILLKYWLEVSPEEQTRRLSRGSTTVARSGNSRRWTSSPTIAGTITRVCATRCSRQRDTAWAPWYVARSEDKKRVRLNVISHLLKQVPYKDVKATKVKLPKRKIGKYKAIDYPFKYVPERF